MRRERELYRLLILSAVACLLCVGCGSISPRPDIVGISYGFQGYDDLPVPQDFTFDESDSSWAYRRYENSALNLRSARFRYVGDRDVRQLVSWFNEQMPQHGWKQTTLDKDRGGRRARLVFNNATSEAAVIDIVRESGPNHPDPLTVIIMEIGVASAAE